MFSQAAATSLMPWADIAKLTDVERRQIDDLLKQIGAARIDIRESFIEAVERAGRAVKVEQVVRLLEASRVGEAIDLVQRALARAGFGPILSTITDTIIGAGRAAASSPDGPRISFDATNFRVLAELRRYERGLIREISAETRASVEEAIRAGNEAGRNPRDMAKDIRGSIGLTQRQTRAVMNFRRLLESGDMEALSRKLRDGRFDKEVLAAIRDGKALPKARIDLMVRRYFERYLKYRSEVIARTESTRAINLGHHLAWQQAIDSGAVEADALVRHWIYTHDSRTRNAHRRIPGLNKKGVGLAQHFKSDLGPILYPGDPAAVAANTVQCRCGVVVKYRPGYFPPADEGEEQEGPSSPTVFGPAPGETAAPEGGAQGVEEKTEALREEMRDWLIERGKRTGTEALRVIDLDTGEELKEFGNTGDEGFVGFPPGFAEVISDPKRRIEAHHNHPSSSSLSSQDLAMQAEYPGLARVVSHGHMGTFFATDRVNGAGDSIVSDRNYIGSALKPPLPRDVSGPEGMVLWSHAVNLTLHDLGRISYEWRLTPELEKLAGTGLFKEMRKRIGELAKSRNVGKARKRRPAHFGFIDPPGAYASMEDWLSYLEALKGIRPRTTDVREHIEEAEAQIALLAEGTP